MATTAPTPKPESLTAPPVTPETPVLPGTKPSNREVSNANTTATTEIKPVDANPYGASTLKKHEWLNGKSIRYEPVTVLFLTGDYAGKTLDLGYNVPSLKESATADWRPIDTRGVRGGVEFHNLSTNNIDFTLEYWSDIFNVRQLLSNLSHLKEITGKEKSPPQVQIKIGGDTLDPFVCTKIDTECSNPLPGDGGYRKGTANLSFILQGGSNTKHATGKPLGATPLSDVARTESESEKARAGEVARIEALLAPCLGSEGSDAVKELVENNKTEDPDAIAALPPRTLVNLAISGLSPEILADPDVQAKLSQSVAQLLAETEPGGNPSQFSQLAQSLQSGEPNGISGDIVTPGTDGTTTFNRMVGDYNTILESITNQELGSDSPLFDRNANPTAGNRINNFGSCGMTLRQAGGIAGGAPNESTIASPLDTEEKAKLDNINQFFQDNPSHEQLTVRFELPPDTDKEFSKCLIAGRPFDKRRGFEDEVTRCSGGKITGGSMWGRFN